MSKDKLYIIVRSDMDSMTAGRACAQVSHATMEFIADMAFAVEQASPKEQEDLQERYLAWCAEGYNFGNTIILEGNKAIIQEVSDLADGWEDVQDANPNDFQYAPDGIFVAGVYDPQYPLQDGDSRHFAEVLTTAYIFGSPDHPDVKRFTSQLALF